MPNGSRTSTNPIPSYHGLAYWPALGHGSFILKARVQLLRDMGMAISPFNAFMFLQGLETLSLRMERHWSNAQRVAEFLDAHDQVESVNLAGLESSPWHERAKDYGGGKGYGSVLAFEIAGGHEAGKKFVEGLDLHSHVANIGDARSLVIHPAIDDAQPAHRRGASRQRRVTPVWFACRSASSRSTTSSPTSSSDSLPPPPDRHRVSGTG